MYQNYIHRNNNKGPRFKGEEVNEVLAQVADLASLTPWEESFIQSVRKGYAKYGSLTEGQFRTLKKVAHRNSPAVKQEAQDWRTSYSDEMRETAKIMARYYKSNPPYFHDLAAKILAEDNYIPSKKAYAAMCENKYASRVLETARSAPLFPAGQMAIVRKGTNLPSAFRRMSGKMVVILETLDEVISAAKGSKRCLAVLAGGDAPFTIEERWLKKLPKKLR